MKNLILLCLVFGLIGCKESNTGLDKKIINTSYDKCIEYLTASLKSPSSLKISEVSISTNIASAEDINSVFGNIITKNGAIKNNIKEDKVRFRELKVGIDYEAQNSFGASIRNWYQCDYLFRLNKDETSPKPLNIYLYKLIGTDENNYLEAQIPISNFTGSNLYLNNAIKKVIGTSNSSFSEIDSTRYNEVEEVIKSKRLDIEAENLRQSWDKAFKE